MSVITVTNTTLGEMLTRKSVGTSLKAHTRDELIEMETKRDNATGFVKKYYSFMQKLTGKRSIKSYEVAPRNEQISAPAVQIPAINNGNRIVFSQNSLLEKMVKGN